MSKEWLKRTALAGLIALSPLPAFAAGSSIVVTYKDDIATLDPAIGYDWQNWSMIKSLFSRLVDYTPGTADIVPRWPRALPSRLMA
jgi:ABC-type transport system substrate-binding protein